MITFNDLKNKKGQKKESKYKYRETIKNSINEFLKIYFESLELPAETFKFMDGQEHPYVFVVNRNGLASLDLTLDDLDIDKVNGASIVLHTVVDDEPPIPSPVPVRINVYFIDGHLEYSILEDNVNDNVTLPIRDESDIRKFCELVKESIIEKIDDEQIGKKSVKDDSVKLWD
ncbi:hypothetical protein JOU91_003618 [Salmonella enterica]|nr:hypothetical protein [Salmonella enterica]EEM9538988.1 hypothetical protein [Salmonella enterica]EEN0873302.1 hypothetical protein [Salmonella enterica]EEN1610358.1 hypothetical protein [Salmonella enterica]EFQ3471494.1 hypothetical protein [Salmonella enterica]